jgi:arginyl-tRNA synthetase
MTARLGSVFAGYIFESEAGIIGKEIVKENTPAVYTESDGAIIFEPTEEDLEKDKSLHTRVFINKDGNPTYEAKDTGLLKLKFDRYNPDLSIFVTDSEQGPYFNVVSNAAGKINSDWRDKTHHMIHGRMQFKGEKMSSRLGNTPIVSDVLQTVNEAVYDKSGEREMTDERADMISIAAIKYTILRTQPGKAINFDPETSLSFEGDSGPYLQYTYARCQSILRKADEQNLKIDDKQPENWQVLDIEKMLYRLPEIFESAFLNYAPQTVTGYVTEVAQLFNSWYGNTKIIDAENSETGYKLAVVKATATVVKKSLWALGIDAPEQM